MVNAFAAERDRWISVQPLTDPVWVNATFTVKKPAGAPKRRRTYPTSQRTGDLDKLVRAVCDALQDAGVIVNDAQVVEVRARKVFPLEYSCSLDTPGAVVAVYRVED